MYSSASAGLTRLSRIYSSHRIASRTGCVSWYATEFFAVSRTKSIPVDSRIGSRRKDFDLYPSIATMTEWGDRWMAGRAGVPVELIHQPCGHKINPKLVCPRCNLKIDARDMSARPGP